MTIDVIRPEDVGQAIYRRVAELHAANLDQGFLATLGTRFLALMYQAIGESPTCVLIVAHDAAGEVVGFIAGGGGMSAIYRRMLRRWRPLGVSLLPVLVSPSKLWRIVEILRYGRSQSGAAGETSDALPEAELFSIAVDAAHRGKGHAEELYRGLERHFRGRGEPAFRIVVGDKLAAAHRFYRRMGAQAVARIEVHRGEHSVVYVHALN